MSYLSPPAAPQKVMAMIKKVLIGFGILCLLIAAGLAFFWYQMQQPLYTPGMVREGKNLRAGRADARRRDAGDVFSSSRSGNEADARPPPRPFGLRLTRRAWKGPAP
jgi:hypothetical protein